MRDLSDLCHTLTPSSQAGGNTVQDWPAVAMTAPGSPSVSPAPDVTDHMVDTAGDTPRQDYAPLIASDGGQGARPGQDGGGWTRTGQP